jgi:hypothetical protein
VVCKGWIFVLPCFGTNCNRHASSDHLQFEYDPELVLVTLQDSFHTRHRTANAVTNAIAAEALRLMLAVRAGKPLPHFDATTPVPVELARKPRGRYGEGDGAIELMEQVGNLDMLPGSSARMRTKAGTMRQVGRTLNNQDRPS